MGGLSSPVPGDQEDRILNRSRVRKRLTCTGLVQGVGFRPLVHRLAIERGLTGSVWNDPDGAAIEIEGSEEQVRSFLDALPVSLPALARLDHLEIRNLPPKGGAGFRVDMSRVGQRKRALLPPDAALCPACDTEMSDPEDRRYRYPFTTCTECGPRYTLVHALPYDRSRTSMACFPLCEACEMEYSTVSDRRFHAEPIACPVCGPRLWLVDSGGGLITREHVVDRARKMLAEGSILAVKGLGGFQLACRADRNQPVRRLRTLKNRLTRPFALMGRSIDVLKTLVSLSNEGETLLRSPRSPILLAPVRSGSSVVSEIAPGLKDLGVMIPTTPLHRELFRDAPYEVLVMTSGNLSEEPICRGNREAIDRLGPLSDALLLHDRDIVRRVDDSVLRQIDEGPVMIRRSRGWVPDPLPLPLSLKEPVLALGGHLQVTACIGIGDQAFLTQHIGDLDTPAARAFLEEAVEDLESFLEVRPKVIVTDIHPDYPTTWLGEKMADSRGGRVMRVQHHLAHAFSLMGEEGRIPGADEKQLSILLDGTGWGPDGSSWGGEWISIGPELDWSRVAHLEPLPLVGGEQAVREPWRILAAALARSGRTDLFEKIPLANLVPPKKLLEVGQLSLSGTWPSASGAGRIFEAAGAMLGLAPVNRYEGEAAQLAEAAAGGRKGSTVWGEVEFLLSRETRILPSAALLTEGARRLAEGEDPDEVASSFHATFARLVRCMTRNVAPSRTLPVAAGGGCLVNRLLRSGLRNEFSIEGIPLFLPSILPPGDGGLAFGQVVAASLVLQNHLDPVCLESPCSVL